MDLPRGTPGHALRTGADNRPIVRQRELSPTAGNQSLDLTISVLAAHPVVWFEARFGAFPAG
jgi:hypothetical protein